MSAPAGPGLAHDARSTPRGVCKTPLPAPQPLFAALQDLILAHDEALGRTEALIGALVSGDVARVQAAVAAQVAAVAVIEGAEKRRRAAEATIAARWVEGRQATGDRRQNDPTTDADRLTPDAYLAYVSTAPGEPQHTITSSVLLDLLAPGDAAQLRRLRHELLARLVRLQVLNRQAARLLRGAQAVVNRVLAEVAPQTMGYGPRGEHTRPRSDGAPRRVRSA